jgi:hypothetical protein
VIGGCLGYALAGHQKLVSYKLLNITGILYGILGIVVLAEFVAKSDALKNFMVYWVAGVLLWAHSVIPLGALVGAAIAHASPSAAVVEKFFAAFFSYSLLILGFLDFTVVNPKLKLFTVLGTRTQVFGLILLLSGLVAQLIAALQDFNG